MSVRVKTSLGEIKVELFCQQAPKACKNFLALAASGYYDGTTFHRNMKGFMVQGGDPTGSGMGGPGYKFECECKPWLKHEKPGMLSMANAGPNTNGSQFFMTHVATPWLDGKHAVFGSVKEGQDVVDAIVGGDKIDTIEIHDSTEALFAAQADRIKDWNAVLEKG